MKKELLTINVHLTTGSQVKSTEKAAKMLLFDGSCNCDLFKGTILPGGVDTQITSEGKTTLSARYMLEGTDNAGSPCHIFIENNGTFEEGKELTARPKVITDSESLNFLENTNLISKIEGTEGGVIIHIFEE